MSYRKQRSIPLGGRYRQLSLYTKIFRHEHPTLHLTLHVISSDDCLKFLQHIQTDINLTTLFWWNISIALLKCHWIVNVALIVRLAMNNHWFSKWLDTEQATSNYMNPRWRSTLTYVWVSLPQFLNTFGAETIWTTFRRRHFQAYFRQRKCLNLD